MLDEWIEKIKEMEKKKLIAIGLIVAIIIFGAGGLEKFGDDGGKEFNKEQENGRKSNAGNKGFGGGHGDGEGDGDGDGFGGDGMEGAAENPIGAASQLGGVLIGLIIVGIMTKPRALKAFNPTILGKDKLKDKVSGASYTKVNYI